MSIFLYPSTSNISQGDTIKLRVDKTLTRHDGVQITAAKNSSLFVLGSAGEYRFYVLTDNVMDLFGNKHGKNISAQIELVQGEFEFRDSEDNLDLFENDGVGLMDKSNAMENFLEGSLLEDDKLEDENYLRTMAQQFPENDEGEEFVDPNRARNKKWDLEDRGLASKKISDIDYDKYDLPFGTQIEINTYNARQYNPGKHIQSEEGEIIDITDEGYRVKLSNDEEINVKHEDVFDIIEYPKESSKTAKQKSLHRPGDYWENQAGEWRAISPGGTSQIFNDEDNAKEFADSGYDKERDRDWDKYYQEAYANKIKANLQDFKNYVKKNENIDFDEDDELEREMLKQFQEDIQNAEDVDEIKNILFNEAKYHYDMEEYNYDENAWRILLENYAQGIEIIGSKRKAYFMVGDQIYDPRVEDKKTYLIEKEYLDEVTHQHKYTVKGIGDITADEIEKYQKVGRDKKLTPNIFKDKQDRDNPSEHGFREMRPELNKKGNKQGASNKPENEIPTGFRNMPYSKFNLPDILNLDGDLDMDEE